jgi:hypothetical protein
MMLTTRRCTSLLVGSYVCQKKNQVSLGFRFPHYFNLAMLVKQIWRLISNTRALLCERVLQAKYYHAGNILNAEIKNGSSYT